MIFEFEAKNVSLNPPQTWEFQAKKTLSSNIFGPIIEYLAWPPSDMGIFDQK